MQMPYNLTNIQHDILSEFLKQIQEGQDIVWEAFDSSLMSDAKSAIYGIVSEFQIDNILPDRVKSELLSIMEIAWSEIVGSGDTATRVQKSHGTLAKAEQIIVDLLSNSTKVRG
jgi:hypothetical protein